jgi:hypothetical protein
MRIEFKAKVQTMHQWIAPVLENKTMKTLFFIEVTDTFGGEANYSWVTRHVIQARTQRGAINRFSRMSGMNWHAVGRDRYDSKSGATCFFIETYDAECHKELRFDTDERDCDQNEQQPD